MAFGDLERKFAAKDPDEVRLQRESALSQSQFTELGLVSCDRCKCSDFCPQKFSLKGPDGQSACAIKKLIGDDVQKRMSLRDPVTAFADLTKEAWKEYEFEKFRVGGFVSKRGQALLKMASENMLALRGLVKEDAQNVDLTWLYNRKKKERVEEAGDGK